MIPAILENQPHAASGFLHRTAQLSEIRMHYVIGGRREGIPVVLLHGFPQTWYMWRKIMPGLGREYRVVAPDLRGFGDSSKPAGGYDTRRLAGDVHELVEKLAARGEIDSRQIIVAGHDMGAVHAYTYAAVYRDEVRKLAFLDEPLPSQTYEKLADLAAFHDNGGFWFASFNMTANLPEALTAGRERILLSYIYENLALHSPALTEGLDEYVRAFSLPGAAQASRGVYREIFTSSAQIEELSKEKLKIPVLALGGEFGLGPIPLGDMQAVAENVRGGVIEDCGHYLAEEQSAELERRLLEFFGAESGETAATT